MSSFAHSAGFSRASPSPAAPRVAAVAFSNALRIRLARSYIALSPMRSPKRAKSSIIFSPASSP